MITAVHIRQKALGRRKVTRDTHGQFDGDPTRLTLCGAEAGLDMSYDETRFSKYIEHVSCAECVTARMTAKPG